MSLIKTMKLELERQVSENVLLQDQILASKAREDLYLSEIEKFTRDLNVCYSSFPLFSYP